MEYPKLRVVQFFPVFIEGKRMGCLHDPQRLSDKPLLIPWNLVPILTCLDGTYSLLDIQVEYTRHFGDLLFRENLVEFLEKLDNYLFLDSERFRKFEKSVKQRFLDSPVRPAFFSGLSYSSDPRMLEEELEEYFTSQNGPGLPGYKKKDNRVTGIVAPHIDLKSGGSCYAWAYSELFRTRVLPELFIILGTCHSELNGLFSLTEKTFQTPFGMVKNDTKFTGLIKDICNIDLFSEEFLHRSEHTIEFQILFLQFIWKRLKIELPPLHICPILCAFTPECFSEGYPSLGIYRTFVESLKKAISLYKKSVCIIASVDLSHIGIKFGDRRSLDQTGIDACFREDGMLLDIIAQQDQKEFQSYMLKFYNKRRICGYPPLKTLLDIIPPSKGTMLNYGHTIVDSQGSIVTYASMIFNEA